MWAQYRAPALRARGLITGVCLTGSLLTSCSAPDDVQGPPAVAGVDVGIQPSVVPTGGLVGEWKLDGNATDTKSGFNATLFGSPPFITGKIGKALDLTGNGTGGQGGDFAEMPNNATLNDLSEGAAYSISAWFNAASAPSGVDPSKFWMVVGKSSGPAIGIAFNSARKFAARHYLDGNVLQLAFGVNAHALNQWHHVVAVVVKGSSTVSGSLKLYVNGQLEHTDTWTGGLPAKDFGTTVKWRIGKSDTDWSAHGRVDQVRFYNVALTAAQVSALHDESQFRFAIGMQKGQQADLLGMDYVPDGQMTAQSPTTVLQILEAARNSGARITIRVAGGNEELGMDGDPQSFDIAKWKANFRPVGEQVDANSYLGDGTLIGHYALDEPFWDFPNNMQWWRLEDICEFQKSFPKWSNVPCFIRELPTFLEGKLPAGGTYSNVDAGWAQIADHHYDVEYQWNMGEYFRDNLAAGNRIGLGLMYGFNLINGGREVTNCAKPGNPADCAMTPDEIKAVADALAGIGHDQGCGVIGWYIEKEVGSPERTYFFRSDVQAALAYLNNRLSGLRPGSCGP